MICYASIQFYDRPSVKPGFLAFNYNYNCAVGYHNRKISLEYSLMIEWILCLFDNLLYQQMLLMIIQYRVTNAN